MDNIMEVLTEDQEDETVDEDYEEYLRANIVRDEELFRFVEDFMNSEELYLARKKPKQDEKVTDHEVNCICTECWEEKVDLVKNAQKIWAMELQFEKFLQNSTIKERVKHQDESIKVIREKIAEAKRRYVCHREERELLEEKRREAVLEDLKTIYHVKTEYLSTKSKPVQSVLVYNKIRHVQRAKRKERMAGIFKRILSEYKRQRQIEEIRSRRYDTKVVRKEKIIEGMEVVGTHIELLPRPKLEEKLEEVEEEKVEEKPEVVEPVEEKPKKEGKDKKDKQGKDSKKGKEEKTKESKSAKKDKKDKKDKKGKDKKGKKEDEVIEFTLPYVPITNLRHKIKLDEDNKMVDLIKQFEANEAIENERENFEIQKELVKGVFYPEDSAFVAFPKILLFQDFKNGVVYKKKLRILNGGTVEKKCRFNFVSLEEFDPTLVQVEPVATKNVIPGMFFYTTITFAPETLEKSMKGNVMFLTYTSHNNEYLQIALPIVCTPYCSHVTVAPETVTFQTLPVWEARRRCNYNNFKTIKVNLSSNAGDLSKAFWPLDISNISNAGKKPCKISINKIRDPFFNESAPLFDENLPTDTKHETSRIAMVEPSDEKGEEELNSGIENEADELGFPKESEIIDECVEYVFNAFVFDSYYFEVDGKSERIARIYFRNVDYVGSYNEKYVINFYEEFDGKNLECVGSRAVEVKPLEGHTYGAKLHSWRNHPDINKTTC